MNVKEYWLVDPEADEVEVFCRSGKAFNPPVRYARGQILTTALLPGLELELDRIFN